MNDKIKFIREKCIAANPEIMKVDVGCEVLVGVGNLRHTIYEVSREGLYSAYLNRPFPKELEANDFYDCEFSGETTGLQILGRPIRLADVLLAIEKSQGESEYVVMADGHFIKYSMMNEVGYLVYEATKYYWNLHANDLEKQSLGTINFLADLLTP